MPRICAHLVLIASLAFPIVATAAEAVTGITGTLIVLNKRGNDASFIDVGSGKMLATLSTGRGPHELVVTSDGRWAIGTDYAGGNSLTVFDVENLQVARTIDLSEYPRPHGILLLPGEQEVIVTAEGGNSLVIVGFHRGEIVRSIDTTPNASHMVALSADGTVAYASNGATNSVSVIDVTDGKQVRTISVPARPEAIMTNRAGSEVWVGSNDDSVVTVLAAENEEVLAQWAGFDWPYRILLTRDERYAVIPDLGNERLRFFDVSSKAELGSINLQGMQPQGVVLHPDDRTLFLSLSGQDKVLAINIETRAIIREYATGSAPDGIGWSPLVLRKNIDYQR